MEINVFEDDGAWWVEAIDMPNEGAIYQTKFINTDAERRAREYAEWLRARS